MKTIKTILKYFGGATAALLGLQIVPALATEAFQVGAIYLDAQGYYAGVRAGIGTRAAELGQEINIIETNARGDVAKESQFINTLSVAGIDALILSAVSADGSVRSIERARERGIPVICYNTCINDKDRENLVFAYAVGDPFRFGRLIGEFAAVFLQDKGIQNPKIGVVNCEQFEVCITRRKGFESALNDAGLKWEIVANQEGSTLDRAVTTAKQILSAHPEINIMFGQAGGSTLGAVKAVESAGRVGEVFVVGGDMTTEIAEALKDNKILKGVVDISGRQMGELALDLALKAANNQTSDKVVQAPIDLYTSVADARNWLETHPDGLP